VQRGLWPTAAKNAQTFGSTEPYDFSPMFSDVAELLSNAERTSIEQRLNNNSQEA
jgi:hypothetical protein